MLQGSNDVQFNTIIIMTKPKNSPLKRPLDFNAKSKVYGDFALPKT